MAKKFKVRKDLILPLTHCLTHQWCVTIARHFSDCSSNSMFPASLRKDYFIFTICTSNVHKLLGIYKDKKLYQRI
jgi:hypothetical protein